MSGNSKSKDTSEKKKQKKKSGEVTKLNLEKDNVTIKDLRKSKKLNKKVDEQLKFLGLDSGESDENGISASKSISLGELEIISNFCKNKSEKEGRLRLLQKVSYFSSVYQWSAILDFYAAWLRQIEIGKKTWNDDPQVLESAVLTESNKCSVGNLIHLHNNLLTYSDYNYENLRIPIYSRLNVSFWRQQLVCYFDKDICEFLEFGWPVGINFADKIHPSCKKVRNHAGARQFSKDIDKYIKKEASYGAILGPFKSNPFRDGLILSPLNSVPKADSEERRVIMDFSFPRQLC
ncbi:unnamed protein product [Mytilus coruscus]|uniref:Uncharacterized protein n=1 Tax=Mytilus coruscus TaxID=42192 RepID=A0A6J8DXW9_MYTCO|nr:unnamed protein product [Mytilus coruscus]